VLDTVFLEIPYLLYTTLHPMKPLSLKPGRVQPVQEHHRFIDSLKEVFTTYRDEIELPSFVESKIDKLSNLLSMPSLSQVQIVQIQQEYSSISHRFPVPMPALINE